MRLSDQHKRELSSKGLGRVGFPKKFSMTSIDFDLSGNMKMKTDAWPANTVRVDNQMNYPAVYLDNQKQVNQWPPLTRLGVFNGFENN